MKNKTVSIHIVTYNSAEDIIECLTAVLEQDYPIEQVIVIDNASSDGCAEKVRAFYSLCDSGSDNSRFVLIQNQTNTGFAPAHNQAISVTQTDYVLVLNPDLSIAPDYVSRLVARMEANPQIGSTTGKLLLRADHQIVDSTGLRMNRSRRAFDRGAGEPSDQWRESGPVFGVSGAAAMYSRRMINDISVDGEFFDGDFFAYKEDVDVAWRAQLLGWQGFYDAEAVGYHERGWKVSGRDSKPMFIRRISYINRYKMIYKNEKLRTLFMTLIVSIPYEIAAHGYMLLKEPGLIKAWKSFFYQIPELKRKRKYIQGRAGHAVTDSDSRKL
ncbi:glycosyltransferase family 2 protein [Paenibacillus wynnii]|uniref:glycosyltransferase family 2 protein n=1 Tax=Paenibacillus wynnii TaxID=268407 RepID=UPI00278D507F|nr:glycosyltransferase family 2 protein [Paenibacillus wynnii]MDQ0196804.1 GT2 family glycosyltransferase [Paenibacillus wynnii]